MAFKEEIQSILKQQSSLSFVDLFLHDHKKAEVFLVGGALRDCLMGRPVKDIDLVIRNVAIDKLITWLQKHGKVDVVGKSFGVIKFNGNIDIALPRTEIANTESLGGYRDFSFQSDPNLPIEDDLSRRDFTINAMAFNLATSELIDPFHGQDDLEHKVIRAVGNPHMRFKEDLTRILRGLRFASELNFEIEPETFDAMKSLVSKLNQIQKENSENTYVVSRETIGNELSKAFYANPSRTLELLQKLNALEELFPSVWRHLQVQTHYLDPVLHLTKPSSSSQSLQVRYEHAVILLLRNLSQIEARTTLSNTGLDTMEKDSPRRLDVEHILWMIHKLGQHLTPQNISDMRASHFEKQFLGARGTQHIHLLNHLGHNAVVSAAKQRRENICSVWRCDEHEPIPPLVTGDDVLRHGIPAGARVREILDTVRDFQLDGKILTREAAIRCIQNYKE